MAELFRFRQDRAPQRRSIDPDVRISLYHPPPADMRVGPTINRGSFETLLEDFFRNPKPYVVGFQSAGITILGKPASLTTQIKQLDEWLTSHHNHPSDEALSVKLNELSQKFYDVGALKMPDLKDLGGNAKFFMKLAAKN